MKDALADEIDDYAISQGAGRARKVLRVIRKGAGEAANIYQAEDDLWKLYALENEKARYSKAMPELSKEIIEERTAAIVCNTYPTYSRVPEAVRIARKIPLIAPFVSFPAEVIRTTYHTLELARQELADPRLRSIGATRVVGTVLALSVTKAIEVATRFLTGVSKDDDDDLRHFVPEWQKNSSFAHLGRATNGDFRYVDLAYSDPHNTLITPVRAFLSGRDMKDGIWNGLKDIAEPFTNEEILFKALTEAWRNSAGLGGRVYNPEESVDKQAQDITAHIWKAFEPGTITSVRRIGMGLAGKKTATGRAYNPGVEALATATGQRIQELDIRQSLAYRVKDFAGAIRDANKILLDPMMSRGNVSDNDLREAYKRSDVSRRIIFRDMSDAAQAAIRLGVEIGEVRHILKSNGVPSQDVGKILAGVYAQPRVTKERLKSMRIANPEESKKREDALLLEYEAGASMLEKSFQ